MPDMSKPGAHLRDVLEELDFKKWEHNKEATKHRIMAEVYEECHRRLKRAMDEEAAKAEAALDAGCVAELN